MIDKTVTVTGAFGNIGLFILRELLSRGYRVRAFDLPTKNNKKRSRAFNGTVDIHWGDIRTEDITQAITGSDYVVHLAFVMPSASERNPEHSFDVNVHGTENLLSAMTRSEKKPGILLSSSFSIYGDTRGIDRPITLDDPPMVLSHYIQHKIKTEELVRNSGLPWCIFRLGAVMSVDLVLAGNFDTVIFDQPPDARQEFIHSADAALAVANALETPKAWNRTHLISGGKECQFEYRDLINLSMKAMGIGSLPDKVFSPEPRQGGAWIDTAESQKLLAYQRHTYHDHLRQIQEALGAKRYIIKALSPLIRYYFKRMSPYYKGTSLN